jgi:hypothetical protein
MMNSVNLIEGRKYQSDNEDHILVYEKDICGVHLFRDSNDRPCFVDRGLKIPFHETDQEKKLTPQ